MLRCSTHVPLLPAPKADTVDPAMCRMQFVGVGGHEISATVLGGASRDEEADDADWGVVAAGVVDSVSKAVSTVVSVC